MSVDNAWDEQKDDVFNVVADIDPPSARIEYAFKAGWFASQARVERLTAALEFYADPNGYRDPHAPYAGPRRDPVGKDQGQRARAALNGASTAASQSD